MFVIAIFEIREKLCRENESDENDNAVVIVRILLQLIQKLSSMIVIKIPYEHVAIIKTS